MSNADSLRLKLGITKSKIVDEGLAAAEQFFRNTIGQDAEAWVGYLRGIDFHKRVHVEWIPRGTRLIRYESTGDRTFKPFVYFTRPGTSPTSLGTSFASVDYKEFETDRPIRALVSTASGISFGLQDRVSRAGGGIQYIVAFRDAPSLARVGSRK